MKTKAFLVAVVLTGLSFTAKSQTSDPLVTVVNNKLVLPEKEESSFQVNVLPSSIPSAFRLFIQNPEKRKLQVLISHRVLGELVDTTVASENFSCRYLLDQADDGQYRITVSYGKEKVVKDIELNTVTTRQVVIH